MVQKKRVVKAADVRRAEILKIAENLFQLKGYEATSVEKIVRTAGVAKGTFYYYFKSKQDILEALTDQLMTKIIEQSQIIADDPHLDAITKFCRIIHEPGRHQDKDLNIVDHMHRPENREMHERNNIEIVRLFGPILASVVEQGKKEGVFDVEDALATIQFILAGSLLLFGENTFYWTESEHTSRMQAMLTLIERSLGAVSGSLAAKLAEGLKS